MNQPDHYIPEGPKTIGLNSALDCLEHPDNEGWIFNIRDLENNLLGSAKKFVALNTPALVHYSVIPHIKPVPVIVVTTNSDVLGYDSGDVPSFSTEIYIIKDRVVANAKHFKPGGTTEAFEPILCVEKDGERTFGFHVEILGPSMIVYNPDTYHELGGKVRILTDAEVRMIELPSALMEF